MDRNRYIHVSASLLNEAALDPELSLVVSTCLILKSQYVNSVMSHFSYRKLTNLLHCRFDETKKIVALGLKKHLLTLYCRTSKKGKTVWYLKTNKLYTLLEHDDKYFTYTKRFGVIKDAQGNAHIFLNSKKGHKKYRNFQKYSKCTKAQTLADVEELIISVRILQIIKGYLKSKYLDLLDRLKDHGLEKKFKTLRSKSKMKQIISAVYDSSEPGEINWNNTGISYWTISKKFGKRNLSEYKISKCIHKLIDDGILEAAKCERYVQSCDPNRHYKDDFGLELLSYKEAVDTGRIMDFVNNWQQQNKLAKKANYKDRYYPIYNQKIDDVEIVDLHKRGYCSKKKITTWECVISHPRMVRHKDGTKEDKHSETKWKRKLIDNPNRYRTLIRMANTYELYDDSNKKLYSEAFHTACHEETNKKIRNAKKTIKKAI